jgi:hypothetical protein
MLAANSYKFVYQNLVRAGFFYSKIYVAMKKAD